MILFVQNILAPRVQTIDIVNLIYGDQDSIADNKTQKQYTLNIIMSN